MYKSKSFKKVDSFLNAISPVQGEFKDSPQTYIFRGQGNSSWKLIPSILRKESYIPYKEGRQGPQYFRGDQLEMEWDLLSSFVKEANANGFHLPNEDIIYKILDSEQNTTEASLILRHEVVWPASEYLSILALAQHYGLPTRLLDWSYDSLVAAYFAAKQCIEELKKGKNIKSFSVFGLNSNFTDFKGSQAVIRTQDSVYNKGENSFCFQVVKPPTYFNAHLKAQKGLFTCPHEFGNIKHLEYIPLCLRDYVKSNVLKKEPKFNMKDIVAGKTSSLLDMSDFLDAVNGTVLYEFKLPATKSFELLYYLDKLGINASSLFPTLSGCVDTMYERTVY